MSGQFSCLSHLLFSVRWSSLQKACLHQSHSGGPITDHPTRPSAILLLALPCHEHLILPEALFFLSAAALVPLAPVAAVSSLAPLLLEAPESQPLAFITFDVADALDFPITLEAPEAMEGASPFLASRCSCVLSTASECCFFFSTSLMYDSTGLAAAPSECSSGDRREWAGGSAR